MVPLICGGQQSDVPAPTDTCHRYNYTTDTWDLIGRMPWATIDAGSDYHPSWGLVIAGGGFGPPGGVILTQDGRLFEVMS